MRSVVCRSIPASDAFCFVLWVRNLLHAAQLWMAYWNKGVPLNGRWLGVSVCLNSNVIVCHEKGNLNQVPLTWAFTRKIATSLLLSNLLMRYNTKPPLHTHTCTYAHSFVILVHLKCIVFIQTCLLRANPGILFRAKVLSSTTALIRSEAEAAEPKHTLSSYVLE